MITKLVLLMAAILTILPAFFFFFFFFLAFGLSEKPSSVNIGAIFTFDSVIGRVAESAIELAVSDVNHDPTILPGTHLTLITRDSNCSVFLATVQALQVVEREVVAIIGPQSSAIAHILSGMANGLRVPIVSYAATDPTLSALQFPFFLRTTHTDACQMAALAHLILLHQWNQLIVLFVDNEYGRNGISALEHELHAKSLHKLSLPPLHDATHIAAALNRSKLFGPRVYVVHVDPDPLLRVFTVAKDLHMMTAGYVWFATDWLASSLDSLSPPKLESSLALLQGVVTLRPHIPQSPRREALSSRWAQMKQLGRVTSDLNTYALYAYDTVWTVASAIHKFIQQDGNVSFSFNDKLTGLQLRKLKLFDGGSALLEKLLETNFTGSTGVVRFDQGRNLISQGYEIINLNPTKILKVGYWSNITGFSVSPVKASEKPLDQKLNPIIWPGGVSEKPRGWVIAVDEKPLRIVVPYRTSFVEFVTKNSTNPEIGGYCIDVFNEARKFIPYDVPFRFEPFGDGHSNPKYDELVRMVANDVYDAAVGDIAIVKNRTEIVDFSQPYASTGLVIVAPISHPKSNAWVFLKPFTWELWCVTVASFVIIAIVIWMLEHRVNDDFRGPPQRQLVTMFLFSFSTLFKKNQEDTVSPLGRMVMIVWLFLLLVITSSYTASLTSILTVQQLSSPITGIDSLIASNLPIGYQVGSFVYSYLTEILYVPSSRLVLLRNPEEFERYLRLGPENGGVAAIIDELPYVELFLSKQTEFGIIGQAFTRSGWGFAFKRDSPLAVDMSTAILKLSETGKLSEIHRKWFCKMGCPGEKGGDAEPNQLHLMSFWGLYLVCAAFCLTALTVFLLRMVLQFVRYKRASVASDSRCSGVIYSFFDFVDEKEEAIKRMFAHSSGRSSNSLVNVK